MNLPNRASDTGPDTYPRPFFTDDAMLCEACGKPCTERMLEADPDSLELLVCSDCFEQSVALGYAERTCQTLHDAIIRSRSIKGVRRAMKEHKASCSVCGLRVVARGPVNSLAAP